MTAEARRLFGDWRGYALVGLTLVFAIAALVVPAMPQPLAYHGFADGRTLWGVGNFFNVQSNAPFLIAGISSTRARSCRMWCFSSAPRSPVSARRITTSRPTTRAWSGIACR
jgi:hypothetical protein